MKITTPDGEVIEYDDFTDFNQSLDEEGDIDIAGFLFKRSEILFQLDILAYLEAANEFNQSNFENLKQLVFDELPSCISYNYRLSEKGFGASNPVQKLLHLKDTWEAVIFILYALLWGEVRKKQIDLSKAKFTNGIKELNFTNKIVFSDALKQKLENIRAVLKFYQDNNIVTKCGDSFSFELITFLRELQDIRNDISHHTTPTKEQAKVDLIELEPTFKKMLLKLDFLKDCQILRFESYTTKAQFETFNGHSLNKEFDDIHIDSSLLPYILSNANNNIFVKWDDEIFSLSPFLHFISDTTGHESYLCFFKGKKEGKYWFEPTKLRKEVTFEDLFAKHEAEKAEIQSLIQSS